MKFIGAQAKNGKVIDRKSVNKMINCADNSQQSHGRMGSGPLDFSAKAAHNYFALSSELDGEFMIKLFNQSRYPDRLLIPLLAEAYKQIGVRGAIAVKITEKRSQISVSGFYCHVVPCLGDVQRMRWDNIDRWVPVKGVSRGYIHILLPSLRIRNLHECFDLIGLASLIYRVILHEFAHARDFRSGKDFPRIRTASGKRLKHDNRPEEISANWQVDKVMKRRMNRRVEDTIIDLACFFEGEL